MSSSKAKTFYDIDIDGENESPAVPNSARNPNDGYSSSSIKKSEQLGQMQKSASAAKRLDSESSLVTLQKQQSQLAVKIENVAFSYKKNKPILKNITLFVPEGKFHFTKAIKLKVKMKPITLGISYTITLQSSLSFSNQSFK